MVTVGMRYRPGRVKLQGLEMKHLREGYRDEILQALNFF
jgi:hypothetical protein